jgi:hypothetical protein
LRVRRADSRPVQGRQAQTICSLSGERHSEEIVPRLSYFYGIAIYMYYREHLPPHFHAIYGSHDAEIAIRSRRVLRGALPNRALALVRKWAKLYEAELTDAWLKAQSRERLRPIAPLD